MSAHANADGPFNVSDGEMYRFLMLLRLVSVVQVCKATRADPTLSKVVTYLKSGWPVTLPDLVKPYFSRREELSIEEGCVLWGVRVIVPIRSTYHVTRRARGNGEDKDDSPQLCLVARF